ncbi:xylulokinase [Candidatus Latescibacterota bacterium]
MAELLLGIDLGTSGIRAGLYYPDGTCAGFGSRSCPLSSPQPGFAEQDPEGWWRATCEAVREALNAADSTGEDIAGISFSGQMHGTVLLDQAGLPVSPAIIWADTRSDPDLTDLAELVGEQRQERILMNPLFSGTQAATLHWLMRHDRPTWQRVRHILLPKDYLRFRMCGLYHTEPSDASSTLLCDLKLREWSDEILNALGVPLEFMPFMVNSDQNVGETEGIEPETGIPDGIPVVIGGSDQACAALGNGIIDPDVAMVTIGTGAQVFTPLETPQSGPGEYLRLFCHLPQARWCLIGATITGGLSLSWYRDTCCEGENFENLMAEAGKAPPGSHGIIFISHLNSRGLPDISREPLESFRGLRYRHTSGYCIRAIMERIVYELLDLFITQHAAGIRPGRIIAAGGFTGNPAWVQILADCFERPVQYTPGRESACYGAALAAGVGIGHYRSFEDAAKSVPPPAETVEPILTNILAYRDRYDYYLEKGDAETESEENN